MSDTDERGDDLEEAQGPKEPWSLADSMLEGIRSGELRALQVAPDRSMTVINPRPEDLEVVDALKGFGLVTIADDPPDPPAT